MKWKRAHKKDLPALLDFLLPQEWRSVAFTSRLRDRAQAALPPRRDASIFICRHPPTSNPTPIQGAVLMTATGLVLPVLAEGHGLWDQAPHLRELNRRRHLIHSIMGIPRDVHWIADGISLSPGVTNHYYLMTLKGEDFPEETPTTEGVKVRVAGLGDLESLYPLQRDYELEDVVISRRHFQDRSCHLNLKRILRKQLVVLAELQGRVVAKGNTNARGFGVDQIGGVFTVKSERSGGLAFLVLRELLKRIFRTKRTAALFVKKRNQAALRLYHKLGFSVAADYQISYYRVP